MAIHEIDVKWTQEREWDSGWQTHYSGVAYLFDDEKKEITQEVREKHANARTNSEGDERVLNSSIVSRSDVPSHVLKKLISRRFLRPEPTMKGEIT